MNRFLPGFLGIALLALSACTSPEPTDGPPSETTEPTSLTQEQQRAVEAIAALDEMRSGLARTISADEDVNAETFARVCRPVGMQARTLSEENGWLVRQVAVKYRNPANAPDAEAEALFARFEDDPTLDSLWLQTAHDGTPGWRYLQRITVEPACLACHGAQDARPDFVKTGYPEDRAYGFEVGDLRGLYSVFIPDSSSAGQGEAVQDR